MEAARASSSTTLKSVLGCLGFAEILEILIKNTNLNIQNKEYIDLIEKIINEWNELIGKNLIVGQLMDFKENIGELLNLDIPNNNSHSIDLIYYKNSNR